MNNETEKQYLLLFRGSELHETTDANKVQEAMDKFQAWFEKMSAKGIVRGAQPLHNEGRILSGKNGRVADGPFVESKEAIGGYLLIAANSLDEAVAIMKNFPGLEYGTQVEVRPVAEECPHMTHLRKLVAEPALATA